MKSTKPNLKRVVLFAVVLGIVIGVFHFVMETFVHFESQAAELVVIAFAISYAIKTGYFYDNKK